MQAGPSSPVGKLPRSEDLREEDKDTYHRFLSLLSTDSPLSIPLDTFYGAITHFISTLPTSSLSEFLSAVATSATVFLHPGRAKAAIALGVTASLAPLGQDQKGKRPARWWPFGRGELEIRSESIVSFLDVKDLPHRREMILAVLEGMIAAHFQGNPRAKLEEQVLLMIAERLQDGGAVEEDLVMLVPHIRDARLRLIDLKGLSSALCSSLMSHLRQSQPKEEEVAGLTKALARTYDVLLQSDSAGRRAAVKQLEGFCGQIREAQLSPLSAVEQEHHPKDFTVQKLQLFAFLLPTLSFLPVLLAHATSSSSRRRTQTVIEVLQTLSTFASLLEESEGGVEGYHRLLYACLDILSSSGPAAVRQLLSIPRQRVGEMSHAGAGWWLTLGESLVHDLDGWSVREVVLPLIQRCIYDHTSKVSFEAAHAMVIALLQAATDTPSPDGQREFLDELVGWYAPLLISQAQKGYITTDQICEAYPTIVLAAATLSNQLLPHVLDVLDTSSADRKWRSDLLRIWIAIAPALPHHILNSWLGSLSEDISAIPEPRRGELEAAVFKMIMNDLPDSSRRVGMERWSEIGHHAT